MATDAGTETGKRPLARRIAWFVGIWLASVAVLAVVGLLLRGVLGT
jgi:hypothetical protein